MKLFRKKAPQKESKVVKTPENVELSKPKTAKTTAIFLIWNILSIALYSCYCFFVTYRLSQKNFLSKVILYLLFAYAIIFIILIFLSINSRKTMKNRLKNYKSAVKFFKYAIQIINFTLSIFTAISAFITTGTTDFSAIMYAILSLVITLFFIVFEIAKIIVRKNIPIIKYHFLEIRENNSSNNKKEK